MKEFRENIRFLIFSRFVYCLLPFWSRIHTLVSRPILPILAVIQIRMDPHQSDKPDPDLHQFADEYEPIWAPFQGFWAFIWKIGYGPRIRIEVSSRIRIRI